MLRSLLQTADLHPDDLQMLLQMAADVRRTPLARRELLRGDIVLIYMAKPSTRTRLSFDAAVHRLGGDAVVVGPADLQLDRGETLEDTARVVSRYARCVIMRTYADEEVRRFSAAATVPVINALTDLHHPCQSLADLLTLQERFGELRGLRVAYVGDGNNVVHSLIQASALAGIHLTVATPVGYAPDAGIVRDAVAVAERHGGTLRLLTDPVEAVARARAVYTDTWTSMGDPPGEREARLVAFTPYRVDATLMSRVADDAVFMHCLPAHRGEEVTDEVLDGPRSVVLEQAENRMHTEQALLVGLLGRRFRGSGR